MEAALGVSEEEKRRWSSFRRVLWGVVDSKLFGGMILTVIFLNTLVIALQTDYRLTVLSSWYFDIIDNLFLGIYVFEALSKMYCLRRKYHKNGWNLFDLFIVLTSFIEYVQIAIANVSLINPRIFRLLRVFRAIRALRALRVLRSIRFLRKLQIIVSTLLSSIPAMINVIILLLLIMLIFSLIGRSLYAEVYPERFGNLFQAFFLMFQLMTLDNWSDEYRKVRVGDQYAIIYFLFFIVIASFILVNLFIAVLVSALEASQVKLKNQIKKDKKDEVREKKAREKAEKDALLELEDAENQANASSAAFGDALPLLRETSRPNSTGSMMGGGAGYSSRRVERTETYYYPGDSLSVKQKQLAGYYLMLLASSESNMEVFLAQQRLLDELVDVTTSKADEDNDKKNN